jgi:hypothetical protein
MSKKQYEYLSDNASQKFLALWAITTPNVEADFDDDFATFFAFDGV